MKLLIIVVTTFTSFFASAQLLPQLPQATYQSGRPNDKMVLPTGREEEFRAEAFTRAKVWSEPAPIGAVNLRVTQGSPNEFTNDSEITCKWVSNERYSGATPKFLCAIPNGEVIKVKYHREKKSTAEVGAEPMATRLLSALGFGTDSIFIVKTIRCFGCPKDPYSANTKFYSPIKQIKDDHCQFQLNNAPGCRYSKDHSKFLSFDKYTDFQYATIERRLPGKRMISPKKDGWGYTELANIDASRGGASKAELDAFRIVSVFLNHADNKDDNQMLTCTDSTIRDDGYCKNPVAFISDAGTTFGSSSRGMHKGFSKLDVVGWEEHSIWSETGACMLQMKGNMTESWKDIEVGEEGRKLAARLLSSLKPQQIRDLFEGARIHVSPFNGNVDVWIRVFNKRLAKISSRTCPVN